MVARFGRSTLCPVLVVLLLLAGCNRGDTDQPEPSAPATAATAVSSPSPSPSPAPREEVYTVEAGDTLSEIARRFDTTVEALVEANDLDDPDVLDIGDELTLPRDR